MNCRLSGFLPFGITVILFFIISPLKAQLTGVKTIPGDYATITAAVTAVNAAGVGSGGVVFNIDPGFTETIASVISLTATGTAANPIVFQKDPAASGANPLITSYTGGTGTPSTAVQDGIFRLIGSDYVTIDGIDLRGNPANTTNPSTMEYGYALYKQSLSNGCQYVSISNCVITLNRINNDAGTAPMVDGSVGILMVNSTAIAATTILVPITVGGTNSNNSFYGNTIQNCNIGIALIGFAAASPFVAADQNNEIGGNTAITGNTIINFGGAAGALTASAGIRTLAQYELNIAYNTINSNTGVGVNHENILRGIYVNTATSARASITNNTISIKGGGTTQNISAIENASGSTAIGNEITINNNTIANCSYNSSTTGSFYGIYNIATPAILNINGNTLSNNSTAATATGLCYPIWNNGAATTNININENNINGINFSAATSVALIGIYNQAGGSSSALSISNNNIQGITHSVLSTSPHTYINNAAATLSQFISSNTFTNLNVNTTGAIIMISNSVVVPGTGNQVVDDNAIVGSFTRTSTATTGALTLFTSSATCAAGSVISNSNNDFSNINVSGAATISGWVNTDAGASSKTIQGNIFSNWTGGTGAITVMSVNLTGTTNATVSNLINNITSAGNITGISTAAGNDNLYGNSVTNLSSSGGAATFVTGIAVGAGTTKNIYQNIISGLSGSAIANGSVNGITVVGSTTVNVYENKISGISANALTTGSVNGVWVSSGITVSLYRNKIYNLSTNSAAMATGGFINGIQVSGSTANVSITLRNNIIGDLKATAANITEAIRGISLLSTGTTSNLYVYYNTIHLNASSSGTNFGSSGIYQTTSGTSTTASLDMRNNIIHNISVPNGTGLTVAYRRSNTTLTNYSSNSNNNLFYAGTASTSNLLFWDGTNADQTLVAFKARMATRDAASVSEDLVTGNKFLSTVGSSINYLHMDDTKSSAVKSGGANIAGIAIDFDNDIRQGNAGYSGTGSAPDIGADEYAGITYTPLTGTYNVGSGQTFTSLTNAGGLFAKINRVGLSSSVTVNITSDLTETGVEGLNEWVEIGAGNYSLTIQPNNTTPRLISGDVLAGLIRLNGADRVIIDGGVTKVLTFRNTNALGTTGTAITLINGATNNIIRYCNLEAYTNATNAVLLVSTSANIDGGNSNNHVEYCNINATVSANNGIVGVLVAGTNVAGFENSNNTISNNNIYNYRDRGIEIKSTGSISCTISGNSLYNGSISGAINYASGTTLHGIRVLGGPGHSVINNFIGGSAALATGSQATYASTTGNVSFQGILFNSNSGSPELFIMGNTIANIAMSVVPTGASSVVFYGIETNGANIKIGGNGVGEGNTIGTNNTNGSISITTSTTATTNTSLIRGIFCNSQSGWVIGNKIGSIDMNNIGSLPASSTFLGIYVNHPTAPDQVNNNTIGSTGVGSATNSIRVVSTSTATTTALTGISLGTSVGSIVQVDGNIIKNISYLNSVVTVSAGGIIGINTAAKFTSEINITNNRFEDNRNSTTMTTGLFYGIQNTGASGTVRINNNTIKGNNIFSASTVFTAIRNTGAIFNTIEINSNIIGDVTTPVITLNVANSGAHIYINNTGGAPTAELSISNNVIQNISYAVNGTGANTFISNTAATLSQAIVGNTFVNLNVQTSANNTFIANSVIVPAAGNQSILNNAIVGTYTKRAGGTVTFLNSTATCATGSTITISNNNFSNVSVGNTTISGIINTDAGLSNKIIQGNTLANWTGGTSAITAITVNQTGTNNATFGNTIRNITGAFTVIGITSTVTTSNDNIHTNILDSIYTTGGTTTTVTGINITGGAVKNIYKNTISNIWGNNILTTAGAVRGILISGGTTINAYQNTISSISGQLATSATINGIMVTGGININIYRNKIYDVFCSGTALSAAVYGIQVSGAIANLNCTINNNMIGDLRAPAVSNSDAIRAIGVISSGTTSTIKVYYNTIYLNASSTGTNFGTSGIYHTTQTTATTVSLDLRNNSVTNISVPAGTGRTAAYRRSSTTLTNYATTSNNNMFYGGAPGANNLIFTDGTNFDQTIAAFKTRVSARETNSITEDLITDLKFFSTTGSVSSFLHMNPNKTITSRGAAVHIAGFTDDFDGDIRFGNAGYSGSGSAPDIGADEFAGIPFLPFAGTVLVGTGQNYTSLTNSNGLFSKINSLGFSGNVSVQITSDLAETGAEALNQWTETGAGNYNMQIQPDASSPRLISGNVLAGLIRLNGADRVKIDGGNNRNLTFRNTNTTGTTGTAFTFINGATNDTIRNCIIEAFANATNGVILFSTAGSAATGNNNNIIEYNHINATVGANTSNVGLYSAGTTGKENSNITIANNKIFDYKERAIELTASGSTLWSILNNSLYNGSVSKNFNYDASSLLHGVRVLGGSGYSIANNYIGGSDSLSAGLNALYASTLGNISFKGIVLTTTAATPASSIKGNRISKITVNSIPQAASSNTFMGIETIGSGISIGGSSAGEGNLIGSNTANSSIIITTTTSSSVNTSIITGINSLHTGGVVTANQVGGIDITNIGSSPAASVIKGIYVNHATAPSQVNSNIIGSTGTGAANNSIQVLSASTATTTSITGIEIGASVASAVQLDRNVVSNISNVSTTSSGSFVGINNTATVAGAVLTISNSRVSNITTAGNNDVNSGVYAGIISTSPSTIHTDTISNFLLAARGTAAQIKGIHVSGAFVHSIYNNWLLDLSTASTKLADAETGTPSGFTVIGILQAASTAGQLVYGNTLSNLSSTTTDNLNTAVVGIGIITAGNSGNIYRNRISAFTNKSEGTSTLSGITGIMCFNGTYNVYNNSIKIDNSSNVNSVKVYGINHATSNSWNYYYNSIYIAGYSTGTAARTANFVRTVNGGVLLRNNVFVNERSGTGNHFAISNKVATPATNWPSTASNFNDLYSATAASTGEWGNGGNNTFTQWKTNSGGDNNSVNNSASFVSSVYDLVPIASTNCFINNSGTPISSPIVITTDLNTVTRDASTPDMGAYEFNFSIFTISADNNGPVCSGGNVDLTSTAAGVFSPTFSWTDPNTTIVSTSQNTTVSAMAGNYIVTVTDANGCFTTASTLITISSGPSATISYTGTPYCSGSGFANITLTGSTGGAFSSTAGLTINSASGQVNLTASTAASYTVTYSIPPANGCLLFTTTAPINILLSGSWTGAVNTDWNTAGNWLCGIVPPTNTNVFFPGSQSNYPLIPTGTIAVKDVSINAGALITVSNATFNISGTISNSGSFTATSALIGMNGTAAQTIPANTFVSNTIKDLTINNTAGVTLAGLLNLTGTLTVTNGSLNTGDSLTLKSNASATARVANITSLAATPVNGKVTVERYIQGRRKYRLLTSSVTTSASATLSGGEEPLSIWGNWQNQGNNVTGNNGLIITGGTAGDGFDQNTTSASMYTYNPATRLFVGYTTANGKNTKYTPLKAGTAYYTFVYGDRLNSISATNPNATVLKATGTLLTGDQLYTTSSSQPLSNVTGRFTLLGNPFASPIDWASITKSNVANTYWGWDPNLNGTGGYVTVNTAGGVTLIAPFSGSTGLNQYIQPGQGFFVQSTTTAPSITIKESDKTADYNGLAFRTNDIHTIPLVAINLFAISGTSKLLIDGTLAAFGPNYSNQVGSEDALKLTTSIENIAIQNGTDLLSIDARQIPANNDTLQLKVFRLTKTQYILQVFTKNMVGTNLQPYLLDNYLQTTQILSVTDSTHVTFTVSFTIPATFDTNRFKIVFKQIGVLPVKFTSISAAKKDKTNEVSWTVAGEQGIQKYEIEQSGNGITFLKSGEVSAKGNNTTERYTWVDVNPLPGNNFYRVRAKQSDGITFVSQIVEVKRDLGMPGISIFPNPVINQKINLTFSAINIGVFTIKIFNAQGIQVYNGQIEHKNETSTYTKTIDKNLPAGIYLLQVENNDFHFTKLVKITQAK